MPRFRCPGEPPNVSRSSSRPSCPGGAQPIPMGGPTMGAARFDIRGFFPGFGPGGGGGAPVPTLPGPGWPPGTPAGGTSPLSAGEIGTTLAGAGACDFLPEGFWRRLCEGGVDLLPGGNGNGTTMGQEAQPCPSGTFKVGDRCVAPGDAPPGGDPFTFPAGMQAVAGSFGMPAVTPRIEQRTHRTCPKGMVLGDDDLCYPRAILSRRSKFRKWRQPPRPPVSAADAKALRKVDRIRDKLRDLGKKADLKVTKR